ncbi:MAG: DnaJ domain-containing protein [Gammaproteobacteria bacterium]|nr:DnaJ domain-containing protein [Gammaproteobacteria bacterium]
MNESLQSLELESPQAQDLLKRLISESGKLTEFELIKKLKQSSADFFAALPDPERLYEQHFWVMFNLYRLQSHFSQHQLFLNISAIDISLHPQTEAKEKLTAFSSLSDFYLDLSNILLRESDVNKLLNKFWEKYLALDQKSEALKVLKLDNETKIDKKILKRQYQKLAALHHPDKGGSADVFNSIQNAYLQLKTIL